MNFLAHAHLSFGHPPLLVGNMISDFVKGSRKFDYPEGILAGIHLHRQIDAFTDDHAATREAREMLRPAVRLYAGAFVDVAFDHFLANDAAEFSDTTLHASARQVYAVLTDHETILPAPFRQMLPFMKMQNWLYNYRTLDGTRSSFGGVVRRSRYLTGHDEVFELFTRHYTALEDCYKTFFPDVKAFAAHQIENLQTSQPAIFANKKDER